jgi:hypothetical protein
MKQKFISSLMAIAFGALSAAAQDAEQIHVNAGNVERVNIANNMDVVLIPGQHTDKAISLNAEATKSISLRLSDNSMTISPLRQISRKERIKVYLYVNNLKTISVESNSLVKTIGVLDSPTLEVFVDNDSRVHLKTNGDVKANSLSDTEVSVKYLSDNRIAKR